MEDELEYEDEEWKEDDSQNYTEEYNEETVLNKYINGLYYIKTYCEYNELKIFNHIHTESIVMKMIKSKM